MNRHLILSKIEEAARALDLADVEFGAAVREHDGAPRAEKTVPSVVLEKAMENLRTSRAKLVELRALLAAELPDEGDA